MSDFDPTKYIRQQEFKRKDARGNWVVAGVKQILDSGPRVMWFRTEHPIDTGWRIESVKTRDDEQGIEFRALIINPDDKVVSSGHRFVARGSFGNPGEKAETQAIGRALAFAGYGTLEALSGEAEDDDEGVLPDAPVPAARPVVQPNPEQPKAPAPVDVGVKDRGTIVPSKDSLRPVVTPPAPLWALVERARQNGAAFKSAESEEKGRGLLRDTLDDYAGDTSHANSFLAALFPYSHGHTKLLSAPDKRALLTWKDATDAKSEVNRVIAEYLKLQGQTEMELAAA